MSFNTPQSFLHYVKYAQFVAQLGFFSTTFFCFILVFLTMFGVKRNFGSYTYLLILFPVVGIFFATIELVLYPNVYSHNAGYVFYSTSRPFNMSQDAVTWFLAFYTGVYASTISMLSVQFLYRYWAIFDETNLRFFKGWRFLFWIAYSLSFGFQWAFGIYYFDKIDDYAKNYLRLEMMQKYSTDFSEIAGMTLVAYDKEGNIRWFNICCTLNMTAIMLVQYSIIIYCAVRMYIGMEEKLQMLSISLRNLHNQFFKTLILQIVTPTITLFSPVMLIIYLPLLDLECDLPTGIFLCAFTLYPAMDAIIVMYIVADYKKAAKTQLDLNSIKKQQTYPATAPTTVSTSAASTVGPCNVGCQDGWVPYGGSCYKKMLDALTQSTAEQECITLGAHLASFETNDEATAIKNLVLSAPLFSTDLLSYSSSSQESWIGLSKTSNGAWKWTDASEVEFTNLPTGTSVTGASCVSMNTSGIWKPNDCTSTVTSFICKRSSSSF